MTESPRPFVAFISYSHRDTQWAAWIQKAVERYHLPNALAKETGLDKRIGKVFRDREELTTGQNLGDHLLKALDNSDNLIVICSPNAVNSQWVGQEIEYFKKIGRGDRIFCLLVEGGAEALPEPLLTDVEGNPLEPLAADPREGGDGKRLAKLKLISGILGVKLDQLTRREQARQNQLRAIYTSIAGLFVVMGAFAFISFREQQLAKEQEAFERESAMANAANMVEFAERIRTQIDMESQALVNNQLIEYLERSGTNNLDTETTRYLAQAYQQLGIAKLQQGTDERAIVDLAAADQAVSNFDRSAELYDSILDKDPQNPEARFDMAIADFWKGNIRLRRGELDLAKKPLKLYASQMNGLYYEYPDDANYVIERVYAQQSLLTLLIDEVDAYIPELDSLIQTSIDIAEGATSKFPTDPDIWDARLGVLNLAASGLAQECLYTNHQLLEYRRLASASALRTLELQPRSRYFKQGAGEMYAALGHTYDSLGDPQKARDAFLNAYRIRVELADTDPTNQFAASQVIKSRLDIMRLRAHADDGQPLSFTEQEAFRNFQGEEGRRLAREANLELYWLVIASEFATLNNQHGLAIEYLSSLHNMLTSPETTGAEVNPTLIFMGEALGKSLGVQNYFEIQVSDSITTPTGMDCRSRVNRWLSYAINEQRDKEASELESLKKNNFAPSYLRFYENLLAAARDDL